MTVNVTTVDRLYGVNEGLAWKAPCVAASVGADLSSLITVGGLITLDGVTLNPGDRVLLKDQTDQTQNGIYNANTGPWTLAVDADGNRDLARGTRVAITDGTLNAQTQWILVATNPVLPGQSTVQWVSAIGTAGVSSFNSRVGAVTLTTADVTTAGAAPTASPTFTGTLTAPGWTFAVTTSVPTQVSTGNGSNFTIGSGANQTLQFRNANGGGIVSVSDQSGASIPATVPNYLQLLNNVTGQPSIIQTQGTDTNRSIQLIPGGTGTVRAPTMPVGDNSTAIATTAFVAGAVVAGTSGVTTFNGRSGAVVLGAADITGAGGAPVASPTFTGTVLMPGWTFSVSGSVPIQSSTGSGSYFGVGNSANSALQFQNANGGGVLLVTDQSGPTIPGAVANFLQVLNNVSGQPSIIQTQGTDTNRSIQLVPAGSGTVQAPTMAPGTSSTAIATTAFVANATAVAGLVLRSYLAGLTLSTPGSSATFSVAPGQASDSTNAATMPLASALAKTTAAWVVGTNNGGLDTGTIANSTWYHVHLIERTDTHVVDVLISLSATAPTLPASYTLFRRIGSMKTNASGQWTNFIQLGDEFLWTTPVNDVTTAALSTTATLYTLSVAPGVQVNALFRSIFSNATVGTLLLINSPDEAVSAANSPSGNDTQVVLVASANHAFTNNVRTNISGQVRAVASAASSSLFLTTYGWIDHRGRFN